MKLRLRISLLAVLAAFQLLPSEALAQRHDHEEHAYKHELALFVGGTYETDDDENFFTIGADYEFRFHPRVGIGVEAEYVDGASTGVFALPVVFHVYRGLMVLGGPGFENTRRKIGDEPELDPEDFGRNFLVRVGVQYAFHLGGRISILPAIDFDFVDGRESVETLIVYGVKIGFSF